MAEGFSVGRWTQPIGQPRIISGLGVERWAFNRHILRPICLLAFGLLFTPAHAAVDLGIDVLEQSNYAILKGKRVGLVRGLHAGGN